MRSQVQALSDKPGALVGGVPHFRRPRRSFLIDDSLTHEQIAEQVAFKWRTGVMIWDYIADENYLRIFTTNGKLLRYNLPQNAAPAEKGED